MNRMPVFFLIAIMAAGFAACQQTREDVVSTDTPFILDIPAGFPTPAIPSDNLLTVRRVALGKRLFYDPILSVDSTISCGSCHQQSLAFADNRPVSPGVAGRLGFRNSPTLANVAYLSIINKDGGVPRLDLQPMVPIEDFNEMDLHPLLAADRLNAQPDYKQQFEEAYDRPADPFSITRALGAFMRTLISGNSRYDQYIYQHKEAALNAQELTGMALFFSDRTHCSQCHQGFAFTDDSFQNNGLYQTYTDAGRARVTALEEDIGRFRVPTLRNIALTAPYMHDGSLTSLENVLEHYNTGGVGHFNQSPLVEPLGLNATEKSAIIAFLHTLTDSSFISNPAFQPE